MKTSKFFYILSLISLFILIEGCKKQAEMNELKKFRIEAENQNRNKELAKEFFAAIDKNDTIRLKEILSDDFSLRAPGIQKPWGKDQLFQNFMSFYVSFPDWTHSIEELIAEGDKVVIKLTGQGTHKAPYEGILPEDTKVSQSAMHILTIIDGKVKEFWALEDGLGFMIQLGMELKPTDKKQ